MATTVKIEGRKERVMDASQSERQFFNSFVTENGEFNPFADEGWRTLSKCFERSLNELNFKGEIAKFLDIGCGTGMSKQIYERFVNDYVGVDLSDSAIQIARGRFPKSKWIIADACSLPFETSSFDVIAFSSLLHHIPSFERAIEEGYRVLKPGGVAFAFDPNLLHPAMAVFRHPRSPFYTAKGVSPNERPLLPSVLKKSFLDSRFTVVKQWCQSNIPYRAVAPRFINLFIGVYNRVDWFWEKSYVGRWFGTFVITSGCK